MVETQKQREKQQRKAQTDTVARRRCPKASLLLQKSARSISRRREAAACFFFLALQTALRAADRPRVPRALSASGAPDSMMRTRKSGVRRARTPVRDSRPNVESCPSRCRSRPREFPPHRAAPRPVDVENFLSRCRSRPREFPPPLDPRPSSALTTTARRFFARIKKSHFPFLHRLASAATWRQNRLMARTRSRRPRKPLAARAARRASRAGRSPASLSFSSSSRRRRPSLHPAYALRFLPTRSS